MGWENPLVAAEMYQGCQWSARFERFLTLYLTRVLDKVERQIALLLDHVGRHSNCLNTIRYGLARLD